jgi:hypothetical protein
MSIINSLPDFPVNYFSIDHQKNRSHILKLNDLQIKRVPCLVKCSSLFGEVKKFEGSDCFNFFNKLKNGQTSTLQQPSLTKKTKVQDEISIPNNSSNINDVSNIDEEQLKKNEKEFLNEILESNENNNKDKLNLLALATAMQKSRDETLNNPELKHMIQPR